MKHVKFRLVFSIAMVMVLIALTACGSNTKSNQGTSNTATPTSGAVSNAPSAANSPAADPKGTGAKPKIGVSEIDLKNPFFVRMKKAGDIAAQDYGVDSTWQSADGSLEKQISTVENFIQQKVNAILIDPIDAKGIVPVIAKAKEAGIPVITMGNKVEGNGNFNTLYPDYENMGMVARAIGKALDGKGEVALLTGSAGNFVSDTREKGFKDVMSKEFPNIKIVGVQPTNFDPAQAQRVAETWLNNFPNLNAIAFISDPLGLAAISAAEAKGKKLIYGGVDGDAEMHPFLENGSMVIDVLTGASRVGYWNVAAAARIAKGTKFPTDLFMPTHFVMSAKTADMLKGKGLDIKYLEPKAALQIADGYSEELGPKQSDERISGKQ